MHQLNSPASSQERFNTLHGACNSCQAERSAPPLVSLTALRGVCSEQCDSCRGTIGQTLSRAARFRGGGRYPRENRVGERGAVDATPADLPGQRLLDASGRLRRAANFLNVAHESPDGAEAITGRTFRVTGDRCLAMMGLGGRAPVQGRWGPQPSRASHRPIPLDRAVAGASQAAKYWDMSSLCVGAAA